MIRRFLNRILKKPVLSLVVSGLLVRLFIIGMYQRATIFPDSEGYLELAGLLASQDLTGYHGLRNPGYPLLLWLAGNKLTVVVLLQFALGILTTVLVYKNLLLLKIKPVLSFFTALFLNGTLHVIFYETAILTESLILFVVTLTINIYLNYFFKKCTLKALLLLSLLLGFLTLIKPFYFFLPFVLYAFSVVKGFSIRTIVNQRIVIFIFPVISFLGWSYVNKINTGHFTATNLSGIYISQNCVHFAEKTPDEFKIIRDIYVKHREIAQKENKDVAMSIWFAYDELRAATGGSLADLSYQLGEFSKTAIYTNPKDYLHQVAYISWVDFWKTSIYWNYPDFKIPYFNKAFIGLWYLQSAVLLLFKIFFVVLLPFQLFEFVIREKITHEFVLTIIILSASVLQAITTYGQNSRFSYPFEFLMVTVVLLYLERKACFKRLPKLK